MNAQKNKNYLVKQLDKVFSSCVYEMHGSVPVGVLLEREDNAYSGIRFVAYEHYDEHGVPQNEFFHERFDLSDADLEEHYSMLQRINAIAKDLQEKVYKD